MTRLYNTFEFVGTLGLPKAERFYQINDSASGWSGHRLNFAIQETKSNGAYVELYGGYSKAKSNKVYSFTKGTENVKGAAIEIPWDDRLKDETLRMTADFKKIVVDFTIDAEVKKQTYELRNEIRKLEYLDELTDEQTKQLNELYGRLKEVAVDRHEFISEYDVVVFLAENLEQYKSHKFKVKGSIEYNYHKGQVYRKFKPTSLEIVSNEEPNKLRATIDLFFTKGAVDDKDFAKEKLIYIDTYAIGYDSATKKDQFFPQPVVINATKLDLENEKHVKRLEFYKQQFDVKAKKVNHLAWEVSIFRGADTVEFTEKDLTDNQKMMIELGVSKLEDFKPKGGVLGETVEENRLIKPLYQEFDKENDFRSGAVESSYEPDDLVYVPATPEPKQEVKEEIVEEELGETVELDDLDALFS